MNSEYQTPHPDPPPLAATTVSSKEVIHFVFFDVAPVMSVCGVFV